MNLRRVVVLALVWTISLTASLAQAPASQSKVARIGFVAPQGKSLPLFDAFRKGLADLGYIEGQNVIIESRFADGHYEKFPDIFGELVAAKVDLLAVTGAVTARGAMKSGGGLPIVFAVVVDPVADHVVDSMDHPGGNITGVTSFDPQQPTKQLQLFKEVLPGMKRVAILGDKGVSEALIKASTDQAAALGLQAQPIRVAGPDPDFNAVFAEIANQHPDALLVLEEPVLGVHAKEIAELATSHRIPTLFPPSRSSAGGLISYGTSQVQAIHRMAVYIDKITKGAKPGDLPVERVTAYELVVNMKTAQQLGINLPQDLLKRADRIDK